MTDEISTADSFSFAFDNEILCRVARVRTCVRCYRDENPLRLRRTSNSGRNSNNTTRRLTMKMRDILAWRRHLQGGRITEKSEIINHGAVVITERVAAARIDTKRQIVFLLWLLAQVETKLLSS